MSEKSKFEAKKEELKQEIDKQEAVLEKLKEYYYGFCDGTQAVVNEYDMENKQDGK